MERATSSSFSRDLAVPVEVWLCASIVILFPPSLMTPWGAAGAYVFAILTSLGAIGLFRLRPSFRELNLAFPTVFGAVILISTLIALLRDASSISFLRSTPLQVAAFILLFMLVRIWTSRGGRMEIWARAMMAISVVVSSLAVVEYATKSYIRIDAFYTAVTGIDFDDSAFRRAPSNFRAISTVGNPLILGTFAAIGASVAFGRYLISPRLYLLLVCFINLGATFASLSRSSWMAVLSSVLFVLSLHLVKGGKFLPRHLKHGLVMILVGCSCLFFPKVFDGLSGAFGQVFETAEERFSGLTDTGSYKDRIAGAQDAFQDLISDPGALLIGYGLGAENKFFLSHRAAMPTGVTSRDAVTLRTFDNTLITVSYSFGLVGLGWLLYLMVTALRRVLRSKPAEQLWQAAALVALFTCLLFYNGLGSPLANYLMACILGVADAVPPGRRDGAA